MLLGLTLPASGLRAQQATGQLELSATGSGVTCNNDGCTVPPGGDFKLVVSVTQAPAPGYIGVGTQVRYQNLIYSPTATQTDEIVVHTDGFPGIAVRAPQDPPQGGVVEHGMTAGTPPNFTTSHYEGPVVELQMRCTDTYTRNDVQLPAYDSQNNVLGSGFKLPLAAGGETIVTSDSLTIRCGETPAGGEPTNTPGAPSNGTPGAAPTPDLSSPEGQATATEAARSTATAIAKVTATAEAASGGTGDEDGGGGNTGLWIALGAIGGAAVLLGAGYYGWRRHRQSTGT